ncbi:MAG: caspase domain-containing protein [Pyrinomonadaceae bacterium]
MNIKLFSALPCAVLLLVLALPALVRAQDRGLDLENRPLPPGHYYALVIGNNAYQNIKQLKTAEADAKEVEAILRTRYNFQTKLLLNATRVQILSALNSYRRELDQDASLLIYYAGHGVNDKEADKAYWLPVDARLDENANWISADDITTNIKVIPARHVLIVSDSCYSGTLTRAAEPSIAEPAQRQRYLQKMLAGRSRTLMASGGNEPVADDGGGNHSVFAGALLRGLAQTDKTQFTAAELFQGYVEESVAGRANQTPEYNPLRNSGHESGDFVFMAAQAGDGASVVAPNVSVPSAPTKVEPLAVELSYWDAIKNSNDPEEYKAYLAKYPNGQFAELARRRAQSGTRTPVSSPPPAHAASAGTREAVLPAKLQNVRDCFLSLPEQYLAVPAERRADVLRASTAVVDMKNGYISFPAGANGRTTVAVFKVASSNYLVAVSHTGSAVQPGSKLFFLHYADGQWSDITDTALPVPFDPTLKYELPRLGTTIAVTNRAGAKVYDLLWQNGSFVVQRVR